ncbi:hypothetical protein ABZ419_07830 [Streptomyces cinnamoneus]|uniref:hypothetical protein n=1 Tax=Streptomyces cinnamoneus TaxID=53446 RepID=UPI003408D672
MPPETPQGDSDATQYLPPLGAAPMPGAPLPPPPYAAPPVAEASTQYLPPVSGDGGPPAGRDVYEIREIREAADEPPGTYGRGVPETAAEATQLLPPQRGGAMGGSVPPRTPDAEATALMSPVGGGAGGVPPYPPAAGRGPDAEATALIQPVGGGMPSFAPHADAEATALIPPVGGGMPPFAPHAGAGRGPDAEATALIPPLGGPGGGMPPYAPGAGAGRGSDAEATALIQPVGGGVPPFAPHAGAGGGSDADATALMPPVPGSPQLPPAGFAVPPMGGTYGGPAGARPADAEATAVSPPTGGGGAHARHAAPDRAPEGPAGVAAPTPPVTGPGPATPFTVMAAAGDRPPPAEFDTLFRSATPTQQLPPVPPAGGPAPFPPRPQPQQPAANASYGLPGAPPNGPVPPNGPQGPRGPQGPGNDAPRPPGRKKSPAVLIAAVVAGCAVAGLGAGALLSGGDDDKSEPQKAAVASTSPTAAPKGEATDGPTPKAPEKSADPAEAQAKALDALLKDSNNSRDSVIKAVDSTRSCKDLGKSAADLDAAAGQRNGLVTRLEQTATDQLPQHAELTGQLSKAWKSSASADSHYAAWARQVDGKKGCVKGHARPSADSAAGDRASGDATAAKKKAADLWNPIAKKYGLTQHEWTQL